MLNVLVYPWDGRCLNPSDATILSPLPREKEIDSLRGAGKKGPDGSFQGDYYKKNHVCYPLCEQRKKKIDEGSRKKKKKRKNSKQTSGSHGYCQRSREVKRSREQHKGRGRTAPSPFPSRPFCSLRRGGAAPPPTPGRSPRAAGAFRAIGTGCRALRSGCSASPSR